MSTNNSFSQNKSFCELQSDCTGQVFCGLQPYHSTNTVLDFENQEPLVINTFFHDADITVPITITEDDCLASIAYLNRTYNQFNIFFKYRGFDNSAQAVPDMLNIFSNGGTGGSAFGRQVSITYLAFTNEDDNRFKMAHEVGHVFCLGHTDDTFSEENIFNTPPSCNGQAISMGNFPIIDDCSENVTRDENDPDYNADSTGDFVRDTPASYNEPNICIDGSGLYYLYSSEVVDGTGEPYIDVDVANIMSTDTRQETFIYRDHFTDGQGIRMRESIENDPVLQPWLTDIESLYEPYKGDYYFAGPPLDVEDQPHFQPGFDYHFVSCDCDCNVPKGYDDLDFTFDINDSIDYDAFYLDPIIHENYRAIVIDQLDPNQPYICYDNYNRTPTGGNVKRFNDGVFNTNVTDTPKDSLGINSSTLIQDLDTGLYKIEKSLPGGYIEEEVIQKNNNDE